MKRLLTILMAGALLTVPSGLGFSKECAKSKVAKKELKQPRRAQKGSEVKPFLASKSSGSPVTAVRSLDR
jgi:hypothetical protein